METGFIIDMVLFSAGTLSLLVAFLVSRRGILPNFPYILLLLAEGALCTGLFFRESRNPVPIALGLSVFVMLVVIPLVLGGLSRHFNRLDRFGTASNLLLFRLPLVPSPLSVLEIRVLQAFDRAGGGEFDSAREGLEALLEKRFFSGLEPVIVEACLDLCLKHHRWAEAAVFLDRKAETFEIAARRNPRLLVYALRVRCETGSLEEGAGLLERIAENSPARFSYAELASAYMILLGCAGEEEKLRELLRRYAPFLAGFPGSVRDMWLGRALAARGRNEDAGEFFQSALSQARASEPHILERIERQMAGASAPAAAPPPEIPWPPPIPDDAPFVSYQEFTSPRSRFMPVTSAFLLLNLSAAALTWGASGSADERFVLVSLGANAKFLVDAGQVWRLGSSTLLHAGFPHLILNALGLLLLGKMIENVYGSSRFLSLYVLAGFGGSIASHFVSSFAQLSVGASGAIFGLVGAGIAFLLFYGSRLPPRFRNTYLVLFLFIVAADLLFGYKKVIVDSSAHLGGLFSGFLAAALLKTVLGNRSAAGRGRRVFDAVLAGACAVLMLGSVAAAAANHFGARPIPTSISFREYGNPAKTWTLPVPAHWEEEVENGIVNLKGPLVHVRLLEHFLEPGVALEEQALEIEETIIEGAGEIRPLIGPKLLRPEGSEKRLVVFDRPLGEGWIRRSYYFEGAGRLVQFAVETRESMADAYAQVLERMLDRFRFLNGGADE